MRSLLPRNWLVIGLGSIGGQILTQTWTRSAAFRPKMHYNGLLMLKYWCHSSEADPAPLLPYPGPSAPAPRSHACTAGPPVGANPSGCMGKGLMTDPTSTQVSWGYHCHTPTSSLCLCVLGVLGAPEDNQRVLVGTWVPGAVLQTAFQG